MKTKLVIRKTKKRKPIAMHRKRATKHNILRSGPVQTIQKPASELAFFFDAIDAENK